MRLFLYRGSAYYYDLDFTLVRSSYVHDLNVFSICQPLRLVCSCSSFLRSSRILGKLDPPMKLVVGNFVLLSWHASGHTPNGRVTVSASVERR